MSQTKLTPKQEKFAQCIVSGMSAKDSYYAAYDTTCNERVAYNEASKLLSRDDMQKRLVELREPLENHARTTALTEREKKRAVLWDIIQNGDNNDKCRALDILNKMDAEYTNVNHNINENKVDLSTVDLNALKRLSDA